MGVVKGAEDDCVQDVTRPSELVVDVKVREEDEVVEEVGGLCLEDGAVSKSTSHV